MVKNIEICIFSISMARLMRPSLTLRVAEFLYCSRLPLSWQCNKWVRVFNFSGHAGFFLLLFDTRCAAKLNKTETELRLRTMFRMTLKRNLKNTKALPRNPKPSTETWAQRLNKKKSRNLQSIKGKYILRGGARVSFFFNISLRLPKYFQNTHRYHAEWNLHTFNHT